MNAIPASSWLDRHLYAICQLAGWAAYFLAQVSGAMSYIHIPWWSACLQIGMVCASGIVLTHLLRKVIHRQQWSTLGKWAVTWRALVASVVAGSVLTIAVQNTVMVDMQDVHELGLNKDPTPAQMVLFLNWLNACFLILFWQIIYFIATAFRRHKSTQLRQSELTRALQLAELRLLKSQLNPHFMFNALNAVRSLIAEDPVRAQDAVTRLANTLRYTLNSGQDETVPLYRELEIVEDYLELEQLRFEDRLTIRCEVSDAARAVNIPVMMLQTVVENAIKHGIAALPEGGTLDISGSMQDGSLVLRVANPRPLKPPTAAVGEGIGLRNAAERLRLLFGSQATMDVDLSKPTSATILIRIPQAS